MPRLLDNPDRDFSANPSNDKIDTNIDENLFTSLVAGYSELIDDSAGPISHRRNNKPGDKPTNQRAAAGELFSLKSVKRSAT